MYGLRGERARAIVNNLKIAGMWSLGDSALESLNIQLGERDR